MESQKTENRKGYCFERFPENIRQVGEPGQSSRIYIEDYVITYIHQIFQKKQEKAFVILLGAMGEKEVQGIPFVYGAVAVEADVGNAEEELTEQQWKDAHKLISQHFTGAQILGWGCSVSMQNSRMEQMQRYIQNMYFQKEGMLFFREDLSEKEEKLFCLTSGEWAEQTGYFIFYQKNPLMQDYMLLGKEKKSFEAGYSDKVTANVRAAVHKKEEEKNSVHLARYSAAVLLVLLTVLGVNMLMQSSKKMDDLEKTIETLSDAATMVTESPAASEKAQKEGSSEKTEKEESVSEKTENAEKQKEKIEDKHTTNVTDAPKQKTDEKKTEKKEKKQQSDVLYKTKESAKANTDTGSDSEEKAITKSSARAKSRAAANAKNGKKSKTHVTTNAVTDSKKKTKAVVSVKQKNASYVVRSGDTLSQIVWRQYHTMACMKMVKKANGIKNGDKIKEGQRLILPAYKG